VFAEAKAPLAYKLADVTVLAVVNDELAYDPAVTALLSAVFATPNAELAYDPDVTALLSAVLAEPNAELA